MTLILTTIRSSEVLMTADGRSVTSQAGNVTGVKDDMQKIFPVPDHPVAIAHHGENMLDGKPVGEFLARFIAQQNTGNMSVVGLADELRHAAHPAVRRRLLELRGETGCGFLVVGFSAHQKGPAAVEVFWKLERDVLRTDEHTWGAGSMIASGSGQKQIPRMDADRGVKGSVEEAQAYHAKLMKAACDANVKNNTVGGHVHELVITPAKWEWTQPPKKP
jgi:hypothetical protein